MTESLASSYELVLFDLDGVVYLGSSAVPEAVEAIQAIVDGGTAVGYVTNNASRRPHEVADLLRSLGVPARDEEVLTSGAAAAKLLAAQLPKGAPVLVVGASSLRDELRDAGLRPVDSASDQPAAVVQGYGSTVGWSDLAEGCLAIRAGARWVATNTDATMPSSRGPVPGNGSMVAALSTALGGRRPDVVIGKPEPALFQVAAQNRRDAVDSGRPAGSGPPATPVKVLVVGDRLDTDIEGAVRAGMDSLLVLTGVSTAADVLRATPDERPTHIAADLRGLSKPDSATRVPVVPQGDQQIVRVGDWQAGHTDGELWLRGDGPELLDALRALAAVAWAYPNWTGLRPDGAAAEKALQQWNLTATVRGASAASTDR
jgi:HAD superfamily hydrolase (TIGR01450 family)